MKTFNIYVDGIEIGMCRFNTKRAAEQHVLEEYGANATVKEVSN